MLSLHPFSARAGQNQAHLRLLETTDVHVHVLPYDYYSDGPNDTVGLARTAALIDALRAEATNSLLADNGDFLQGNPLGDYMAYERGLEPGDLHPVIAAMSAMGIEISTLGNHEFNYGLSFLEKALAGANFPVVSANVVTRAGAGPRDDATLLPPYAILDRQVIDGAGRRHPLRVGVIGALPPQILQWDSSALQGRVTSRDIAATIAAWVPQMREDGADIILALSHSGIDGAAPDEGAENASIAVGRIPGVDAVMTGHQHLVFPSPAFTGIPGVDPVRGTLGGTPAVMAGFWGSHVGVIDLMLEREGATWRVLDAMSEARPIYLRGADGTVTPTVPSAPAILVSAARAHEETLDYIRRPVGQTTAPLHSYFALVADDPSVQIVANSQIWYMRQMLAGSDHAHLPVLSAAAPFKAGGRGGPGYYTDVPPGPLAIKNVADLYLYPNTVRAVKVTGAELADWLERSAAMFHQITPGRPDQMLIDPHFPSYNFDVIDGVRYQIDLSQPARFDPEGRLLDPAARRIRDLTHQGHPIDPKQEFVIATNNYRAEGGGDFPGTGAGAIIFEGPDTNRDVLVRYIHEQGRLNPAADDNWRLAPLPGTSVLFDTGPRAAAHLGDVKTLDITPAGDGPGGFARFRISW